MSALWERKRKKEEIEKKEKEKGIGGTEGYGKEAGGRRTLGRINKKKKELGDSGGVLEKVKRKRGKKGIGKKEEKGSSAEGNGRGRGGRKTFGRRRRKRVVEQEGKEDA